MKDLVMSAQLQDVSANVKALGAARCGGAKDCSANESSSQDQESFSKTLSRETVRESKPQEAKSVDKKPLESKKKDAAEEPSDDSVNLDKKDSAQADSADEASAASKSDTDAESSPDGEMVAEILQAMMVETPDTEAPTDSATALVESALDGNLLPQEGSDLPVESATQAPLIVQLQEVVNEVVQAPDKKLEQAALVGELAATPSAKGKTAVSSDAQTSGLLPTDNAESVKSDSANAVQLQAGQDRVGLLQSAANQQAQTAVGATDLVAQATPTLNVQQTETLKSAMASQAPNHISLPVQHPNWDKELGSRMMWMINNDVKGAEVKLNPPQLGPMEIRISMNNDQANISITAAHGATREAVESSIGKLREMLGQEGLNLANVDISQHSFKEQREHQEKSLRDATGAEDADQIAEITAEAFLPRNNSMSIGMIDYFA